MDSSYTPLPAELREALHTQAGTPLRLLDGETQKVYLLLEEEQWLSLDDDYLRRALQSSLDQESRGEIAPLDFEAIKRKGREILAARERRRQP